MFCSFVVHRIGRKLSLIDIPTNRSSHSSPVPRGGGIGIWLSFIITGVLFAHETIFAMIAGIVGLVGLVDDRLTLSSKVRLLFQIFLSSAVVILFSGLPAATIAVVLFLFAVIFITGTSNIYNFMDGINGMAGLTGMVSFGLMAFFTIFIMNDPEVALISISLSSACLGFLPFNIPRAKVFMGDVGSVFLGFVFAAFVVKLSADISTFLCLIMFLCTFYADATVTVFYRWRRGENLMEAHRSHLYQYLSNELGISHGLVSFIYAGVQSVFGLIALLAYGKGLGWQFAVFCIFSILFLMSYMVIKGINPIAEKTRIS
jgi:Fuc2NAc and GlcNAc transferase